MSLKVNLSDLAIVSHSCYTFETPEDPQQPPMLGTCPQDSDLVDLGCDLDHRGFENSPGNSNVQPS